MNLFVISILMALIGLIMIFAAEPIITVLIIALGLFLIISGARILFVVSRLVDDKSFRIGSFVRGGISVVLGILCVVLPIVMVNFAWKTMMVILGVYALLSVVMEAYSFFRMRQIDENIESKKYVTEMASTFVAAIVLFLLPSNFGFTLIKIAGGVCVIISLVLAIKNYKNRPIIQEDAEVVDED